MLSELLDGPRAIGLKQSMRAIEEKRVACAYVAQDAEGRIAEPFIELCRKNNITVYLVSTMRELGDACSIDVGAAVVTKLLQE